MTKLLFIFIIYAIHTTVLAEDSEGAHEIVRKYCEVPSASDFSFFNFLTMQDEDKDSIIRLNDLDYLRVHFCQPLNEACNDKQDYAICLHENNTEIGVGKEPPKVEVQFGRILFRYTGDECNKTQNYTVDIEMKCNISIEKIEANLDIVYSRPDQCSFRTTVETAAACARRKQTKCELTDHSGYYNLKPLRNFAGNYIVKMNKNLSVILNVCHSLVYAQHFGKCDHETMVCLVNETNIEEPSYTRLGNVNDHASLSTFNDIYGHPIVYMDLASDSPCDKEAADGSKNMSSTIKFICNKDATNTLPEYVSGLGTCHYKFKWETAAACSEETLITQSEVNKKPCRIMNPLHQEYVDLSSLEENFSVQESVHDINAVYEFSICSPLKKSNCTGSGIGVCKYKKDKKVGLSKGLANANLMWRRNKIMLNYTDGESCGNNRRSYTTIIFKCAFSDYVFIDYKDPCATIITWSTMRICSHRCINANHTLNLNSLKEHDHNYHVAGETSDIEYHVNVCKPLLDENYTDCTYGTGICKVVIGDEGKRIGETNLGYQEPGLKTAEDGRLYLSFVNGSVCEEDSSKRISAEITFTCDVETHAVNRVFIGLGPLFNTGYTFGKFFYLLKGRPRFESYNSCKYNLNWKTSLVCPETEAVVTKGCLIDDGIKLVNFTRFEESEFTDHNDTTGTFKVNVCGKMNECNGSFVCDNRDWNRKGLLPQVNINNNLVAFKFTNESQCKNDNFYDSLIEVWCTVWEGSADSFLLEEGACNTVIDWARNNTVCKPKGNASALTAAEVSVAIISSIAIAIVTLMGIAVLWFVCKEQRILCVNNTRNFIVRYTSTRREPEPAEGNLNQN